MNKKLRILFLYPNLHMSTLIPNGIAILSAVLKQDGFNNIGLFDPTFYQSPEVTRAQKEGKSRYEAREKLGQLKPFDFSDRGINLKTKDMFVDFVIKVDEFKPDIIFASILEDNFPIFLKFMDRIKEKKLIIVAHRLVTVKNYDEIFFIDKGKITKQGHSEEVLSNI